MTHFWQIVFTSGLIRFSGKSDKSREETKLSEPIGEFFCFRLFLLLER